LSDNFFPTDHEKTILPVSERFVNIGEFQPCTVTYLTKLERDDIAIALFFSETKLNMFPKVEFYWRRRQRRKKAKKKKKTEKYGSVS
jgi:hypothetical protein